MKKVLGKVAVELAKALLTSTATTVGSNLGNRLVKPEVKKP